MLRLKDQQVGNDTSKATGPPVVVVTGASAGVGRAIVRRFVREGAAIGLLARGLDGLTAARQEVEGAGSKALVLPTDVADAEQVEQAAAKVEQQLGPIDIWINNAMVSVLSPAMDMTPEEYRRVTEVTYLGYVHGTLSALRRMLPRDRGVIIQIGSALAYRSIPLQSAYCGAKHAVQGFTESLRSELIHDGSRVSLSTVHLPAVNTPQFSWIRSRMPHHPQPVPPIYQPEVIADAVHWVAHHPRREFWIGWPTVKAIVGDKFIPGLLDHYLARVGYDAQQASLPANPHRPNNLFAPLPGDFGAHGLFGRGARTSSLHVWVNQHRGSLLVLAAMLAGLWLTRSPRTTDVQPARRRAVHALASK